MVADARDRYLTSARCIVLPATLALLAVVYWVAAKLWEPMGRRERTGVGRG